MNKDLDYLVDKYIKENNKEELWKIVFEYDNKVNIDKIIDYYILSRDSFYVCELISIAQEYIDLHLLANKIVDTNDVTFAYMILKNGTIHDIINNEFFSILEDFCDENK